jgi:hypothetical protein
MEIDDDLIFGVDTAADILGVPAFRVYKLLHWKQDPLPGKKFGGRFVFSQYAIKAWMNKTVEYAQIARGSCGPY